ncbi:MAG: RHS repeat domain-containing protein, partial [Planctomycetota bacterium]
KNAAGQATKRTSYTFGVDEITQTVSTIDPSSQLITQSSTLTFAHDGHGSVRALFGAAAAIAQVFTYSAYGELLAIHNGSGTLQPLTSSLTSVLYNGEGLDARTGLYNMRARWYSASNARWERLDPFNGNPTDPFSFHKYNFATSRDPIHFVDPTGMVEGLSGFFSANSISIQIRAMKIQASRSVLHGGLKEAGKRISWKIAQNFVEWYYIDSHINATIDAIAGFAYEVSGWRDPNVAMIVSRLNTILGALTAIRRGMKIGPSALIPIFRANPDYRGSKLERVVDFYSDYQAKRRVEERIVAGLIALGSMPLLIAKLNLANTFANANNDQLQFNGVLSPVTMVSRLLLGSALGSSGPNAFYQTVWLPDIINSAREKVRNSPNPQSLANAIDMLVHEVAASFPLELSIVGDDDE